MLAPPAPLSAQEEYHMRVFWRGKENISFWNMPYFDWLGSAPRPCNFYWSHLPEGGFNPIPEETFADLLTITTGENGSVSLYDPTFQRRGFQSPVPAGLCGRSWRLVPQFDSREPIPTST